MAVPSPVDKVMSAHPLQLPARERLLSHVARLEELARQGDAAGVLDELGTIIPAFAHSRSLTPTATPASIVDLADVDPARAPRLPQVLVEPGQTCPACGSDTIHRSHAKSRIEEVRKSFSPKRPYRCHACDCRGWLVPMAHHTPSEPAVDLEATLALDLGAIDESVVAQPSPPRPAFAPRDLS